MKLAQYLIWQFQTSQGAVNNVGTERVDRNMPRLTKQDKAFIEHLLIDRYKLYKIATALLRDGRGSYLSIYVRTKRWHRTGSIYLLSTSSRPRMVPIKVVAYIVDIMAQRSTYWAEELQ